MTESSTPESILNILTSHSNIRNYMDDGPLFVQALHMLCMMEIMRKNTISPVSPAPGCVSDDNNTTMCGRRSHMSPGLDSGDASRRSPDPYYGYALELSNDIRFSYIGTMTIKEQLKIAKAVAIIAVSYINDIPDIESDDKQKIVDRIFKYVE